MNDSQFLKISTQEDTPYVVWRAGPHAGESTILGAPSHGSLILEMNQSGPFGPQPQITYTPSLDYIGEDSFSLDFHYNDYVSTMFYTVHVAPAASDAAQYRWYGNSPGGFHDFSGSTQAQLVRGGESDDYLIGGFGADKLNGGAGDDTIAGGGGKDVIRGGAGIDVVSGGSGADTFIFAKEDLVAFSEAVDRVDTILDFEGAGDGYTGKGDLIRFTGFSQKATLTKVADVQGVGDAHLYRIDDGNFSAGLLIHYATGRADLVVGDYGFVA